MAEAPRGTDPPPEVAATCLSRLPRTTAVTTAATMTTTTTVATTTGLAPLRCCDFGVAAWIFALRLALLLVMPGAFRGAGRGRDRDGPGGDGPGRDGPGTGRARGSA